VETGGKPVRESVEFARIVAFTDGVFAIAITLLVLSINVPPNLSGSAMHHELIDAWRQVFAYFLSFAVIGLFWFLFKVSMIVYLMIWFRGTFPRYRYDQLMNIGWKVMIPIGMVAVLVNAVLGML